MGEVLVAVEVAAGIDHQAEGYRHELALKIKNTIGLSLEVDLKVAGSILRNQEGKLFRIVDKRK